MNEMDFNVKWRECMVFMHPDLLSFFFIYEQWGVAAAWGEVSRCCDFRMAHTMSLL
jgi:hypothetical protein